MNSTLSSFDETFCNPYLDFSMSIIICVHLFRGAWPRLDALDYNVRAFSEFVERVIIMFVHFCVFFCVCFFFVFFLCVLFLFLFFFGWGARGRGVQRQKVNCAIASAPFLISLSLHHTLGTGHKLEGGGGLVQTWGGPLIFMQAQKGGPNNLVHVI